MQTVFTHKACLASIHVNLPKGSCAMWKRRELGTQTSTAPPTGPAAADAGVALLFCSGRGLPELSHGRSRPLLRGACALRPLAWVRAGEVWWLWMEAWVAVLPALRLLGARSPFLCSALTPSSFRRALQAV